MGRDRTRSYRSLLERASRDEAISLPARRLRHGVLAADGTAVGRFGGQLNAAGCQRPRTMREACDATARPHRPENRSPGFESLECSFTRGT